MTNPVDASATDQVQVQVQEHEYLFAIQIRFRAVDDIAARQAAQEIIPRVESMKIDWRLADVTTKFQEIRKNEPPRKIEI